MTDTDQAHVTDRMIIERAVRFVATVMCARGQPMLVTVDDGDLGQRGW